MDRRCGLQSPLLRVPFLSLSFAYTYAGRLSLERSVGGELLCHFALAVGFLRREHVGDTAGPALRLDWDSSRG